MLKQEEERAPPVATPRALREETTLAPQDAGLFERLRAWRAEEARAQGLPPYVIFHDSVLRDIASAKPASREALAGIRGVGASKLERYAAGILRVLS